MSAASSLHANALAFAEALIPTGWMLAYQMLPRYFPFIVF